MEERDWGALQGVVDRAPAAGSYFSDGFSVYPTLLYAPGDHAVAPGKSQTYSVEGGNADYRADVIAFLPQLTWALPVWNKGMANGVDDIDRAILRALSQDGRSAAAALPPWSARHGRRSRTGWSGCAGRG